MKEKILPVALILEWLCAAFPKAFTTPPKKALAIGVHRTVLPEAKAAGFPVWQTQRVLRLYARHPWYLGVLTRGGYRYDLNGMPCGEVTQEETAHAIVMLDEARKHCGLE